MHDRDYEALFDSMKAAKAYRALRLAMYVLLHADEDGVYTAPSAIHMRRVLASPKDDEGDEEETGSKAGHCTVVEVGIAVRQLVSMGVLTTESDTKTFVLAGGTR